MYTGAAGKREKKTPRAIEKFRPWCRSDGRFLAETEGLLQRDGKSRAGEMGVVLILF